MRGRVSRQSVRALRRSHGAPVAVLALVLAAACARPAAEPSLAEEPELRVGLAVGRDSVALGGDGELVLTADGARPTPLGTIPAGTRWWVVPDTGGVRLVRPDGTRSSRVGRVVAVNLSEGRFLMVNGRRYRGRAAAYRDPQGVTAVNVVPLESYVAGVIGHELGPRRAGEEEALLAQAIVSRTYALRNRGRWSTLGFDAHADVRDQTYLGVAAEAPLVWEAVRRTGGRVLRYRGELIDAYYHSTCGRRTVPAEDAFRTVGERPYLRSVSDAAGGGRYYCERSPRYRWREEWDAGAALYCRERSRHAWISRRAACLACGRGGDANDAGRAGGGAADRVRARRRGAPGTRRDVLRRRTGPCGARRSSSRWRAPAVR
jgi:stage II sporulation protein D